ncbi:MAG: hypothetical protein U1F76_06575 [Candidatus Competibacteraceae bacterium]
MFDNKARQQLQDLQFTLQSWERSVPPRAQAFHRLRRRLQQDIESELTRRLSWIGEETVLSHRQRYGQLEKLADSLTALNRKAEQLEDELRQLQQAFPEPRELTLWWQERCEQWRQELGRLTVTCERQADLFQEEDTLERIETSLRLHSEALQVLQEADTILQTLGSSADTATLEAELPELRRTLETVGPSQDMIRRLKALCQPLQAKARQPTPPELQNLSTLLADIRGWVRELSAPADRMSALEQRHRQLLVEWRRRDPAELQEVLQEADELREQLTEQARTLRERKRQGFEELLSDLIYACGPQPEIQQRLEALKQRLVDRYQLHRDWLAKFEETDEFFKAIADNQALALERRLRERREELETGLQQLQALPLADELRQRVEQLERDAEALSHLQEAQDVLRALRQSNTFKHRLDELSSQAGRDLAELSATQQRLREANGQLQQDATRIGIALDDLTPAIEALDEGTSHRTLEQARGLARELEARLLQNQQHFLERCRALSAERLAEIDKIQHILAQAGVVAADPAVTPPEPTAITETRQAAQRVAMLNQEYQHLEQRVEQALTDCEEQRNRRQAQLTALGLEALDPGDREEAKELLTQLQAGAWLMEADRLQHLEQLAGLLAAGEALVERLSAEQQHLQDQFEALKQRLKAFNQDRSRTFCAKELIDRVTDLIYGLPAHPQRIHLAQLSLAGSLLGRIEAQACRLAAQVVDGQVRELRRGLPNHPDRRNATALLDRITALQDEEPVPFHLRERLRKALMQTGRRS